MRWIAVVIGLLAAASAYDPVAAADPITLDQIMTAIRSVHHVQARYVEHRTLHVLKAPIETRGALTFDAPDRLTKAADPTASGPGERLVMDRDHLTVDSGNGRPINIGMNDHPEVTALATSLRATLAGDGAALRTVFEVTVSGTLDHWQMVLQPRDPAARRLLQWVRVIGFGERITEIDTANGEGDRSEMSVVEQGRS
jgi:Outer membrane lipoprotein carrier protein LolA-like